MDQQRISGMAQWAALLAWIELLLVFGMVDDAFFSDAMFAGLGAALMMWVIWFLSPVTLVLSLLGSIDGRRGGWVAAVAAGVAAASVGATFVVRELMF